MVYVGDVAGNGPLVMDWGKQGRRGVACPAGGGSVPGPLRSACIRTLDIAAVALSLINGEESTDEATAVIGRYCTWSCCV